MKAAVFKGTGILSVEEVDTPQVIDANDVLVKVKAASICGSDLHILSVPPGQYGKPGTIMGHEFVGEVAAVGDKVKQFTIGMRVAVEPNIRCGICSECRSGRANLCEDAQNIGQWRDGGFAEYCVVPQQQLYLVPDEISDRTAALLEPLACVMNGMMRANPMPHENVVVFGAGAIGLIFVKVLKCYGVKRVVVCETDTKRRLEALQNGADYAVDFTQVDADTFLKEVWDGYCDLAIDAVGAGAVLEQAVEIMKCGGRILVFGQNMTQVAQVKPGDINRKELMVFGALSTRHSFQPAINLLKNADLKLDEIVSLEVELSEIARGLEAMRQKEASKVIVYLEKG